MKNTALLIIVVFLCNLANAQVAKPDLKINSIDTSILQYKTVEEFLNLPAIYKIVSYTTVFSSKREVFKTDALWEIEHIRAFCLRAKKGDVLTLTDIIVSKGEKRIKLISKTHTF